MKNYTKSDVMRCAWELARIGQRKFGGNVKKYFSEALKAVWAKIKEVIMIPFWFINKKVGCYITEDRKALVLKETEKAVLVRVLRSMTEMWVPKSVIA